MNHDTNLPSREELLSKRIKQIDLSRISTIQDLVSACSDSSIQSRNLGICAQIYKDMLQDQDRPLIFLGMTGALIAGGMRKVIADMVDNGIVDVIVTTGAIVYQDYYQSLGHGHYKGSIEADDALLHQYSIDRIYDTYVDEEKFREVDIGISKLVDELEPRSYSTREFFKILGDSILGGSTLDEHRSVADSILGTAAKRGVPIFCPGISDSSIGIGMTLQHARCGRLNKGFHIDTIQDNYELTQLKMKASKSGAIYLGGGLPKNTINDIVVIAEMLGYTGGGHEYAIQITTDSPQWGGLSGSTLAEAQSWGKIHKKAKKGTIYSDITLALPLLVGFILQGRHHTGRDRLVMTWDGDELVGLERVSGQG